MEISVVPLTRFDSYLPSVVIEEAVAPVVKQKMKRKLKLLLLTTDYFLHA